MYKYQTLSKEQITNAILCFADRISCSYCPCKEDCLNRSSVDCKKMLIEYLTEEIPQPKTFDFYDGFNDGFSAGYEACKKAIIDKLQKGKEKK